MPDWRALLATCLVHAGAGFTWPALDLSRTVCLCSLGEPGDPIRFEAAASFPLRTVEPPTTTRMVTAGEWPLVFDPDRCGADTESTRRPELVDGGRLSRQPDATRLPILCVSVNTVGRVASVRVRRSSGAAAVDRRVIRAAWQARFRPDRPGRITLTVG